MREYGYVVVFSPEDFNILLFDNRVRSVVNVLIEKGFPQDRIVTKANGETKPKVPTTTPEGRSANRRVELKVLF